MKKLLLVLVCLLLIGCGKKTKPIEESTKKITKLTKLDFGYTTGMYANGSVNYKIICEDKCILTIKPDEISYEDAQDVEIDKETVNKIINILNKYKVTKWDGFKESDPNVLDGDSFHMYLTIQDNEDIEASGYMMFPEYYREVEKELGEILGGYYKMSAKISINNKEYIINLDNNNTTKYLISMLPQEYTMKDLNDNEKYIYIDKTLPTSPYSPKHINKGDVMLYNNNCIVIFYKSFDTNYSYTKIGHIDDLDDLDSKDIKVKIYE